ncbi:MAG: ABC transporter ATP-binding protein [Candidatus Bathyarchaeia archaeon]
MAVGIKVYDIELQYRSVRALDGVSLEVRGGEILSIIGPNGSGKSTLLKVINGVLKPRMGVVYLNGKALREMPKKEVAMKIGIVPQRIAPAGMLTVFDFVLTGRRPRMSFAPSKIDEERAREALKAVGASHLEGRILEELSGGEFQRVVIARALAGEPEVMLLDEPTNNLDLKYQVEILNLIRTMRSNGLCIIMAMHDLTQAYRISDKVLMLSDGKVFAAGKPEDVLTPENILKVYNVPVYMIREYGILVPRFEMG